ncbi:glycoside hydrolase family 25 protein [Dietzia sp.]|uniref:glycoside hydrolase family 25 protein n=1 Tax=Dietzia sp. TaxID=1871616 RepID=UPI002FDA4E7D
MYVSRQRGGPRGLALLSIGALFAVAVLVAALLAVTNANTNVRNLASPSDYISSDLVGKPQGVDAANWQHPGENSVNWKAAAAGGKSFAFIKATDGTSDGNEHFSDDFEGARSAGIKVGAYHKAHPAMDPIAQADALSDAVIEEGGDQLPPVLDLELEEGLSPSQLADWTRSFMERTKEKTGRTPIMYTYKSFWLVQMGNTKEFSEYPLWLAEYRQESPTEPFVGGWKSWTFWQYAGNDGAADGFSTPVDLNVFNGSKSELEAMAGPVGNGASDTKAPDTSGGNSEKGTGDSGTESGTNGSGTGTGTESGTGTGTGTGNESGAKPVSLTIPDMPLPPGVLPKGITLPLTIVLPTTVTSGSSGSTGGSTGARSDLAWISGLLRGLPSEVLKSISFK